MTMQQFKDGEGGNPIPRPVYVKWFELPVSSIANPLYYISQKLQKAKESPETNIYIYWTKLKGTR